MSKKKKLKSFPWWRTPLGVLNVVGTFYFLYWLFRQRDLADLGPGILVLCLFPLSISLKLLVKTSRLSITKSAFICVSGWIIVNVWSEMSFVLLNGSGGFYARASSSIGRVVLSCLENNIQNYGAIYTIVLLVLFIWLNLSSMKVLTSLYRYLINKPYIKEIVREVQTEPSYSERPTLKNKERRKVEYKHKEDKSQIAQPKITKRIFDEDELPKYQLPSVNLLRDHSDRVHDVSKAEINRNIEIIRTTLSDHHVNVVDIKAIPGPTVTLYKVYPDRGVSVGSIKGKANDLSVALQVDGVRADILKDSVGIEVPNAQPSVVTIKRLVTSAEFTQSDAELPIPIGLSIDNRVKVFDLAKTPHLLVAGATHNRESRLA